MTEVKQILTERKKEIDLYLCHLSSIEDEADKTLFKVMKANTFLMLYNLIEAVVSNSIDSIRNSIYKNQAVEFDCLKENIRVQIEVV